MRFSLITLNSIVFCLLSLYLWVEELHLNQNAVTVLLDRVAFVTYGMLYEEDQRISSPFSGLDVYKYNTERSGCRL